MKRPNPKNVNPYDSKAYKRSKAHLKKRKRQKAKNPYK